MNLILPPRLTEFHHRLLPPEKFLHWLRSTFFKSSQTLTPPPDVGATVSLVLDARDKKQSVSTPVLVTRTQPRTLISPNSPRCKLMVRILLSDTAEPQNARFKLRRCAKDNAITSTLVSDRAQQKLYDVRKEGNGSTKSSLCKFGAALTR